MRGEENAIVPVTHASEGGGEEGQNNAEGEEAELDIWVADPFLEEGVLDVEV